MVVAKEVLRHLRSYNLASAIGDEHDSDTLNPSPPQMQNPKAVFTCRPDSHTFSERTVLLDHPVNIGRSVARAKSASNNAIFDCKVLSRQHAVLWHDSGRFYLKDTKSSNGTFVNNNRLTQEEYEVFSGDIVQFGINVIENCRKETHSCIIATLKLYLADGKEASLRANSTGNFLSIDDFFKLYQYLQDALQREQLLESKLSKLHLLFEQTKSSSDSCWRSFITEDLLLTRISTLESQLHSCSKNISEEKIKQDVIQLQSDKDAYQTAAKESLIKIYREKMEAIAKLENLQQSYTLAEQEAMVCRAQQLEAEKHLEELAQKYTQSREVEKELKSLLEDAELKIKQSNETIVIEEDKHTSNCTVIDSGKKEETKDISNADDVENLISKLNVKIEQLESSTDDNKVQNIDKLKDQIAELAKKCMLPEIAVELLNANNQHPDSTILTPDINELMQEKEVLSEQLKTRQLEIEKNEEELNTLSSQIVSAQLTIKNLKKKLNDAQEQSKRDVALEEKYNDAIARLNKKDCDIQSLQKALDSALEELKKGPAIQEISMTEPNKLVKFADVCIQAEESSSTQLQIKSVDTQTNEILEKSIVELEEELRMVKERYEEISKEKSTLFNNYESLQKEYRAFANKSHTLVFFYAAPIILIMYFVMSFLFS